MTNALKNRTEVIARQHTLGGESIDIVQFKNLKAKREVKEKIKRLFGGEMIRSILTPREVDGNIRLNKLARQSQTGDRSSTANTIERADAFGKKTMLTLSTFPTLLTMSYTKLLSKEGDKVYDPFMGHNSRGEDVLSTDRKYYSYDVHTFPVNFTAKACERFPKENYELNLGSSENIKYANETFDFSITCPPYGDVEQYNKLYEEKKQDDLSSKNYKEFLTLYYKCLSETYRVLKKKAYFVIVVGDIHRQGKYTSLMLDTIDICTKLGFRLHDLNIYNRKSNIGGDLNYKTFILICKRFPTIHEFILIFQKPENGQSPMPFKFTPPNPIDEVSQIPEVNELQRARLLRKLQKSEKGNLNKSTETITLNKDIFEETMKLFKIKVKNCKFCNKEITKDNFGIVSADCFVCNDITCLFGAFDDLDKKEESKTK